MSDQDFFFDDEVKETPKKEAAKKSGTKAQAAPVKQTAKKPAQKPSVQDEGTSFSLTVVVLIAIVALLVGIIVGIFIGRALVPDANFAGTGTENSLPNANGMGGMGSGTAPQLTDEQLQQGMPEGHPQVDNSDSTGEEAPSEEGAAQ